MTEEQICKICGNSYKNLGVHVKNTHNLSREEYETYQVQDTTGTDDAFKEDENEDMENVSIESLELSDILEEYKITKEELINLLENRRKIPVTQTPENVAKKLSMEKEPKTQSLKVAEILVKEYGFKVKGNGPTTHGGQIPKTWFMFK